jgi:hypothetical protein
MKRLYFKFENSSFRAILLFFFCLSTVFSYGQLKPQEKNILYSQVVTLKPGMTKDEVKKILGEPYKISFTTNEKHEFIEDLFYKTRFDINKLYILTYQCVFVDAKLVSLLQKEIPFSTTEVTQSN